MKKINANKVLLIIKNNYIINRSIPLILCIVSLILGSLIGAMPISEVETRYSYRMQDLEMYESYRSTMEYTYQDLLSFDGIFSIVFIVVAMIIAILSVLSLSTYMRDKSSNDFYHSMSVTRGEIYLANYITALINSAITIVASHLIGLGFMNMLATYKPMSFGEMLATQLPVILSTLLFLAMFIGIAMLATLSAGTVFAGIINYVFLNFYIPATVLSVSLASAQLFDTALFDYLQHFPMAYAYTSPLLRYIYSAVGYLKMQALDYVILAIITVVIVALGIWLYTLKKNENASKPLPFTSSVRPMQYLLTFDAILLGATFFEAITSSFVWCLVGGLLALFLAFIIFNAFVDKSFNSVFKKSRHMLYILIFTIALSAIFVADTFKLYKEPAPDLDNVDYAYVNHTMQYADRDEWSNYDFVTETENNDMTYSILLDKENAELVSKLYEIMSSMENRRSDEYPATDKAEAKSISISIGIYCKNDFQGYHEYCYVTNGSPYWDEVFEIINRLQIKNNASSEHVNYYEVVEEKAVE